MTDRNDVVIAIAASLYASRATEDALRAEPGIESIANEAWDLYYKLERAVLNSGRGIAGAGGQGGGVRRPVPAPGRRVDPRGVDRRPGSASARAYATVPLAHRPLHLSVFARHRWVRACPRAWTITRPDGHRAVAPHFGLPVERGSPRITRVRHPASGLRARHGSCLPALEPFDERWGHGGTGRDLPRQDRRRLPHISRLPEGPSDPPRVEGSRPRLPAALPHVRRAVERPNRSFAPRMTEGAPVIAPGHGRHVGQRWGAITGGACASVTAHV